MTATHRQMPNWSMSPIIHRKASTISRMSPSYRESQNDLLAAYVQFYNKCFVIIFFSIQNEKILFIVHQVLRWTHETCQSGYGRPVFVHLSLRFHQFLCAALWVHGVWRKTVQLQKVLYLHTYFLYLVNARWRWSCVIRWREQDPGGLSDHAVAAVCLHHCRSSVVFTEEPDGKDNFPVLDRYCHAYLVVLAGPDV